MLYNFNAGPACLPQEILQQIKADIPSWHEGMSILEYGHRLPKVISMRENIDTKLRDLLSVHNTHEVLLMHGGAQTLFSTIPLHYLNVNDSANYLVTGHWSGVAQKEAQRFSNANIAYDSSINGHTLIEDQDDWNLDSQGKYLYFCDNETIHGLSLPTPRRVDNHSFVVADMTSSIASRPIDFSNIDLVFASAQKNLGVSGLCVVIIRKDLIKDPMQPVPSTLCFKTQYEAQCMRNTPNIFAWYVLDLMLDWTISNGGVEHFEQKAKDCSDLLYKYIDSSSVFLNKVEPNFRSKVNIPFLLKNEENTKSFLEQAENVGLKCLQGHRAVGGCRANIYNAMPLEGVNSLIEFMQNFELHHQ
jgi:phosphoserine aminotransferase